MKKNKWQLKSDLLEYDVCERRNPLENSDIDIYIYILDPCKGDDKIGFEIVASFVRSPFFYFSFSALQLRFFSFSFRFSYL